MNIVKLRVKRATVRQLFTKLTTKIENTISLPVSEEYTVANKIETLYNLKDQLISKIDEIKKLDSEIEELIEVDELEEEIINSDKYKETGISCKTKIDRHILSLDNNVIQQSSLRNNDEDSARSIRSENNVVKLPRLNISMFNGDCIKWFNFLN